MLRKKCKKKSRRWVNLKEQINQTIKVKDSRNFDYTWALQIKCLKIKVMDQRLT